MRPEELRYLRIKEGKEGDELWSIYQKSKGGDKGSKTDQRRLYPLFVKDMDGKPINWKLQNRIKINESLPPLGREGMGGLALGTYLKRQKVWQSLKKEAEKVEEVLVP